MKRFAQRQQFCLWGWEEGPIPLLFLSFSLGSQWDALVCFCLSAGSPSPSDLPLANGLLTSSVPYLCYLTFAGFFFFFKRLIQFGKHLGMFFFTHGIASSIKRLCFSGWKGDRDLWERGFSQIRYHQGLFL